MQISLLGNDNSITATVETMLKAVGDWSITKIAYSNDSEIEKSKRTAFDVVVANLIDMPGSPKNIIRDITAQFSSVPLLVLYFYSRKSLIHPLLKAGATGYLQVGVPEEDLYQAVKVVADGQQCIITENT